MSNMKGVEHLKVPLDEIKLATDNFSKEKLLARGGFGNVYSGNLSISGQDRAVAVKRLDSKYGQGERQFLMEIQTLSVYKHKNLVSLLGFCDEDGEKILLYEYAKHGSLDTYISGTKLSWMQRLQICLGAARGFNYLHNGLGPTHRILHRDIKCSNILLNDNWEPLISDFGLSKVGPSNVEHTFILTGACGTRGYVDPQYLNTSILTTESDVYSFGVVLFEILCGRQATIEQYQDEHRCLTSLAREYFRENRLNEIVHADIKDEIKEDSLRRFSAIAYKCLQYERSERPKMGSIIEELEKALELQEYGRLRRLIWLGTWGRQSEAAQDKWSFHLAEDHKLRKMTINHGDIIYSLKFTCASDGVMQDSNELGGSAHGDTVSTVTFNDDEEIVGINGTIDTRDGLEIISSLSFKTTKRLHGPFGTETETSFFVLWEDGPFGGFYGNADQYINSIGVCVKPREEIMKVGPWGRNDVIDPPERNCWSFQLKKQHRLKKITIDHGCMVHSLIFSTLHTHTGDIDVSGKIGGWTPGETVTEILLDWKEELCAINGTLIQRIDNNPKDKIMSSITFVTNRRTYGPFGPTEGVSFALTWDKSSFEGFYGLCGGYVDSIGVYLKAA